MLQTGTLMTGYSVHDGQRVFSEECPGKVSDFWLDPSLRLHVLVDGGVQVLSTTTLKGNWISSLPKQVRGEDVMVNHV